MVKRVRKVTPGGDIGLATARTAVPPAATPQPEQSQTLLELLDMSLNELTLLVQQNPSLYGMLLGYAAEMKLEKMWFAGRPGVSGIQKYDDHDRTRKGDRVVVYKGVPIKIECKSLQTSMIKNVGKGRFQGKVQCDASDRRTIRLPDGSTVTTTCLRVGEFDLLASLVPVSWPPEPPFYDEPFTLMDRIVKGQRKAGTSST